VLIWYIFFTLFTNFGRPVTSQSYQETTSELPFASVSKRVSVRNNSYENVFPLQVNFHAKETQFHTTGFARRLVLKQRHKRNSEIAHLQPYQFRVLAFLQTQTIKSPYYLSIWSVNITIDRTETKQLRIREFKNDVYDKRELNCLSSFFGIHLSLIQSNTKIQKSSPFHRKYSR